MFICLKCKKKKSDNQYPSIAQEIKQIRQQKYIKIIFSPHCYDCIMKEKIEQDQKELKKRILKLNKKDQSLLIDFEEYE